MLSRRTLSFLLALVLAGPLWANFYPVGLPIEQTQLNDGQTIGPGVIKSLDPASHRVEFVMRYRTPLLLPLGVFPAGIQRQVWAQLPENLRPSEPDSAPVGTLPRDTTLNRQTASARQSQNQTVAGAQGVQHAQVAAASGNSIQQQLSAARQVQTATEAAQRAQTPAAPGPNAIERQLEQARQVQSRQVNAALEVQKPRGDERALALDAARHYMAGYRFTPPQVAARVLPKLVFDGDAQPVYGWEHRFHVTGHYEVDYYSSASGDAYTTSSYGFEVTVQLDASGHTLDVSVHLQ
jgi:hypothetical protein